MHFFYEKYKLFLFIFYKIIKMTKSQNFLKIILTFGHFCYIVLFAKEKMTKGHFRKRRHFTW